MTRIWGNDIVLHCQWPGKLVKPLQKVALNLFLKILNVNTQRPNNSCSKYKKKKTIQIHKNVCLSMFIVSFLESLKM